MLRASQLVQELQASEAELRESEARMSLAVDAADVGIWIRDLVRHEIWASEKWRELFGFALSEPLEFNAIANRLHPDDREALQQAHRDGDCGCGWRQISDRIPADAAGWCDPVDLSLGRVESDATGQPALIRGATRDITRRNAPRSPYAI